MHGWLFGAVASMLAAAAAIGQVPPAPSTISVDMPADAFAQELQVTKKPCGHILTNVNVWSPDGQWIVYDTRSDPDGSVFDGRTIEVVNVETDEARTVYESKHDACCGVATFHPTREEVVFIHGPEHPTPYWQYGPYHRHGVIVALELPGKSRTLDARDLTPPFTPGALRGGSHIHIFSPDGQWVSFTYEDHVLAQLDESGSTSHEPNQRNIGVSVPVHRVTVPKSHPRNHDGEYFTVLVTSTVRDPQPGSDEIARACEEGWVGTRGYQRADGTWQHRALAFLGEIATATGEMINEVFIVDLAEEVTQPGDGPLEGAASTRPRPPRGTQQRRLTYTVDRKYPGIQGPRHWLRSSPDGSQIAFLMRDDLGVVQLWTIPPLGGEPRQVTRDSWDIGSTFTWNVDGTLISYIADGSVFVTDVMSGKSRRLTKKRTSVTAPRAEACVFSPDGKRIAYVRPVESEEGTTFNQVFVVTVAE